MTACRWDPDTSDYLHDGDPMKFKTDRPGYSQAHRRIRKLRGPASNLTCVDCGRQAADWSYDGTDPSELSEVQPDGRTFVYSTDIDRYHPRCRPCHGRFDTPHPSRCGTYGGSQAHHRTGTPICGPCQDARREYMRMYRLTRKAMSE